MCSVQPFSLWGFCLGVAFGIFFFGVIWVGFKQDVHVEAGTSHALVSGSMIQLSRTSILCFVSNIRLSLDVKGY